MTYVPRRVLDRALRCLDRSVLADRLHALRALAHVRGMRYLDEDARPRTIAIALKPWVLTSRQLLAFHHTMRHVVDALFRLSRLSAERPELTRIITFGPGQRSWLRLASRPTSRPLGVIGRLDSTATFDHAHWAHAFQMLEPNAVGVGGLHYAPVGCSVVMDVMADVLSGAFPGRVLTPMPDPRQLLIDELRQVARRLGHPLRGVALVENSNYTTGTDEFQLLSEYLARHGVDAPVVDPRELRLIRGHLRARGRPVDLVYRDSELAEFVELEAAGHRLGALRHAVRAGRLISGLIWEFDQKSAWEVFTDARYARWFTPAQRRVFRRHLLWTRLMREARVTDPAGRAVDLPAWTRRHRRELVLKPNTLFGGEGVVIGRTVSQRTWERELRRALEGPRRYVVQRLARIQADTFPWLVDGRVQFVGRHTVSGFFFSSSGIGLVGRFSAKPVVNVAQGGGLIPALWIH